LLLRRCGGHTDDVLVLSLALGWLLISVLAAATFAALCRGGQLEERMHTRP